MRIPSSLIICSLLLVSGLQAQAPDLSANFISGPTPIAAGTSASLLIDVTNVGGPIGGPYTVAIRLSTNTTISAVDPLVGTVTTATFGPQTIAVPIPSSIPAGIYFWGLDVQVGPGETNLSNNTIAGNQMALQAAVPDLVATSIVGPGTAAPGQAISVLRNITNAGGPLQAVFGYDVILTANGIIDASDPRIGAFASASIGVVSITVTIPANTPSGMYFIALQVLPTVGEVVLGNNSVIGTSIVVTPLAPTITMVTPTTGPAVGGTGVTITGTNFVAPTTVSFAGAPASAVTVTSSTTITCMTPGSPGGLTGPVAVAISNANGTASLPNAFAYDPPFPGSGEDLVLLSGVGTLPNAVAIKTVPAGSFISVQMSSPGATFNGTAAVLLGQLYANGNPPFSVVGFPEVQIDPLGAVVILNGAAPSPLGAIVYQPGGITLPFAYPGGLSGFRTRLQAFAVSPAALNGFFAASDAQEFQFQ